MELSSILYNTILPTFFKQCEFCIDSIGSLILIHSYLEKRFLNKKQN